MSVELRIPGARILFYTGAPKEITDMKWFHTCLLAAAVTWTAGPAQAQILIG